MPVYHAHELIHIHVPKTGGTAIARCFERLGAFEWTREFWVGSERRDGRWYEYQHLSMGELEALSSAKLAGYASFAVVRNPYARLLSDHLWREAMAEQHAGVPIRCFDSFGAFLRAIPADLDSRWLEHVEGRDQPWANFLIHVRPQYQYVYDLRGRRRVDEILRFEQLDRDLGRLLARHRLNGSGIAAPRSRDLLAHYDRELLDLVNEAYVHDFECFGYEML